MNDAPLVQETRQGVILIIALNHPAKLNALSKSLVKALNDAMATGAADDSVRCFILKGVGQAFSVGADLREIKDLSTQQVQAADFIQEWERLRHVQKPIIAEIDGYCLGGGLELALMCDLLVASSHAQFGHPEITLGTIPGCGGTQALPYIIGKVRALEMLLTGRMISAQEALAWGLINACVEPEQLAAQTLKYAETIARYSQPAVRMIKALVNNAWWGSLQEGLVAERKGFQQTFDWLDQKEGIAAFLQRRHPTFQDR
jgi:enoyl-CoA hydratase/carnithine racemase